LNKDRFSTLIKEFPQVQSNLYATAKNRKLAQKKQFSWIAPEEVIYFLNRKHVFFLYRSLIIPIGLVFLSFFILNFAYFNEETTPFVNILAWVAGGLMLFGGIGLVIWNAIDWGNDYYIITDRRVVWQEKMVGLYDSRREALLTRILTVKVFTTQFGRILKYGDVIVRTYTTGITMRRMAKPYQFASLVEGYQERAKLISKVKEERDIAQSLEQALQDRLNSPQVILPPEDAPAPKAAEKEEEPKKKTSLRETIRTFLKVRYEQGDTITYRKHWWLLFRKIWLPLFGIVGTLVFWGVLIARGSELISSLLVECAVLFTFVFSLLALIYQYVDWRNDIYRLTTTQIFDIEKKPLGRELKKTANLDTILSIEHERVNILGILLNFGTVTVNVGDTQFIFYGVYNPDQVHQDISDRQEALNRKAIEAEAKRERERMVNWLVAYYEETGKIGDFENNPGTIPFSG